MAEIGDRKRRLKIICNAESVMYAVEPEVRKLHGMSCETGAPVC